MSMDWLYKSPELGPPIPPAMQDLYGINSLYAPAGQAVSPSVLAGVNAPSAVDSLYAAAGGGGGGGGIVNGAKNFLSGFGADAGNPGLFQVGVMRTLAPAGAGLFAANLAHQFSPLSKNSAPEGFIEGALGGAGVGGTLGLAGGPFSEITVPAGMLAGGVIGGGLNALNNYFGGGDEGPKFGKGDKEARATELQSLMDSSGVPISTQDRVLRSFVVNYDIAPDDTTRQQVYQAMQQTVAGQVASQVDAPTSLSPEQILATQALASSVMQPYADKLQQQGQTSADMFNAMADTAPNPAMAALARTMGSNRAEDATRMAAAYEQQALLLPSLNALQLANQYGQQAFAAATRPTSSGTSSIAALLAQAQSGGLGASGYTP